MRLWAVGVGPQRTGSSWLWECLRLHPELCFPRGVKETLFFDQRYGRGFGWYAAHFRHSRPGARCMEIGATYFEAPPATERLFDHAPDCRIVVTLRDPAARTFSLYLHELKKGRLDGDVSVALERVPRLMEGSRYQVHLERWRRWFGPDRVHVVLLDDVEAAPGRVLDGVAEFLAISRLPAPPVAFRRVNLASLPARRRLARLAAAGSDRLKAWRLYGPIELAKRLGLKRIYAGERVPRLAPEVRCRLVDAFEPDIAYVERLLARPLPAWRKVA